MAAALGAALFIGLQLGAVRGARCVAVVRFFKEIGQSDRENANFFPAGSQSSRAYGALRACGALERLVGHFFLDVG